MYQVEKLESGDHYALKHLHYGSDAEVDIDNLLHWEFQHLRKLDHPHIVQVSDFGWDDGVGEFLVMEYVDGLDLREFYLKKGRKPEILYQVMLQILTALSYIHNAELLHCDLKPGNILVTETESPPYFSVKLTDFGMVSSLKPDISTMNRPKLLKGAAPFMPPELLLGENIDLRADLYSLAAAIYFTITGKLPFKGHNLRSYLLNILSSTPSFKAVQFKKYPEKFMGLLKNMMAKEPGVRPQSSEKIIDKLSGFIPGVKKSDNQQPGNLIHLYSPSLAGRDHVLKKIAVGLDMLKKGKSSIFILSGKPGIGKTRILEEIKTLAILSEQSGKHITFPEKPIDSFLVKQLTGLDPFSKENNPAKSLDEFEKDSSKFFHRFLVKHFMSKKNRNIPVLSDVKTVLLLDDLHYADRISNEFLKFLFKNIDQYPVLVAGTINSGSQKKYMDYQNSKLVSDNGVSFHSIPLKSLTRNQVGTFIKAVFGNVGVSKELIDQIYSNAGGNPTNIHSLIRFLHGKNAFELHNGNILLKDHTSVQNLIPNDINQLNLMKWQSLSSVQKEIVSMMALISYPCPSSWIEMYFKESSENLFGFIKDLKTGGFVKLVQGSEQQFLEITRDLYKKESLSMVSPAEKRRFYKTFPTLLSKQYDVKKESWIAPYMARCSLAAGKFRKCLPWLLRSGDHFFESSQHESAAREYQRGLSISGILKDKKMSLSFVHKLGVLLQKSVHLDNAFKILHKFLEKYHIDEKNDFISSHIQEITLIVSDILVKKVEYNTAEKLLLKTYKKGYRWMDQHLRFRYLVQFGNVYYHLNCYSKALKILEKAHRHEGAKNDPDGFSLALNNIAKIYNDQVRYKDAEKIYRSVLEHYISSKDKHLIAIGYNNLGGVMYSMGDFEKSIEILNKAVALAGQLRDPYILSRAENTIGWNYVHLGKFSEGEKHFQRYREICRKIKSEPALIYILMYQGLHEVEHGELKSGSEKLKEAYKLAHKYKDKLKIAIASIHLASYYNTCEEFDQGLKLLKKALRISKEIQSVNTINWVYISLIHFYLKIEDYAETMKNINRVWPRLKDTSDFVFIFIVLEAKVLVYLKTDKLDSAAAVMSELERLLENKSNFQIECTLQINKARLAALKGEMETSFRLFQKVLNLYKKLPNLPSLGSIYFDIVDYLGEFLPLETSQRYLNSAIEIFCKFNLPRSLKKAESLKKKLISSEGTDNNMKTSTQDRINVIHTLSTVMTSLTNRKKLFSNILKAALELFSADRGVLLLYNPDEEKLETGSIIGTDKSSLMDIKRISYSAVKNVVGKGDPIFTNNALEDIRFRDRKSIIIHNILSLMCVPLVLQSRIIGALYIDSMSRKHIFQEEDVRLMEIFANMAAATIARFQDFNRLEKERSTLFNQLKQPYQLEMIVGETPRMKEIYATVKNIAQRTVTVLIEGESGTGKELIAHSLHFNGKRSAKPFTIVNCTSIQPTLAESILFGYKKGAFSGAVENRKGLFESAHEGTLFLDEISELPYEIQGKLLRAIEEKTFKPVGSVKDVKVNIRLICSTNRNLDIEVQEGRFREDLFHRVNVVCIQLPPLRERIKDIPLLINHFLLHQRIMPMPVKVSNSAMDVFMNYAWPGNIRELKNEMERICALHNTALIESGHISKRIRTGLGGSEFNRTDQLRSLMNTYERSIIEETLKKCGNNQSQTARVLGITRPTLIDRLKKYEL